MSRSKAAEAAERRADLDAAAREEDWARHARQSAREAKTAWEAEEWWATAAEAEVAAQRLRRRWD